MGDTHVQEHAGFKVGDWVRVNALTLAKMNAGGMSIQGLELRKRVAEIKSIWVSDHGWNSVQVAHGPSPDPEYRWDGIAWYACDELEKVEPEAASSPT